MKTRSLVYMALFVALSIVFTRILRIMPGTSIRISLTFIVYAVCGVKFGPWFTAGMAILADVIGFFLFPEAAQFNLGITLSQAVTGFMFGLMRGHTKDWWRLAAILTFITIVVEMGMTTYWLTIILNTSFQNLLVARMVGIFTNLGLRIAFMIPLMRAFRHGAFKQEGYHGA